MTSNVHLSHFKDSSLESSVQISSLKATIHFAKEKV